LRATFNAFAPRVTVDYKVTPQVMIFANGARGFRPGTFNAGLLTLPAFVIDILRAQDAKVAVDQETINEYELGMKGRFFENRVQATVTGYWGRLNNQQIAQSFFINVPGYVNTVGFTSNAGRTAIKGVEFEWTALATDRLIFNGHFSWNDTIIKSDSCAACVRIGATLSSSVGKHLESVPEYTASLVGTYTAPFRGELQWRARVEYFFQGKEYAERMNLLSGGAANKVNVRAGLLNPAFKVEAYITNLFDDTTPNAVWLATDLPSGQPGVKVGFPERRQWGLRASYEF
jgi:iron complex outermembrane receptor protein